MVEVRDIDQEKLWEEFVRVWPGANFLQSFAWGEFNQALGHRVVRKGFYKNKKLAGVVSAIVEKGKRAKYLTVPAGPLISWKDEGVVKMFMETIRKIAAEEKCSFVRVRPQIVNSGENQAMFSKLGFKVAPMHLHEQLTVKLDLSKTEEQLLIEMRKATRYEIRQGLKTGIEVEESTDAGEMDGFYDLQMQTASRQAFVPFSKNFLVKQFEAFAKRGMVKLYTARLNGEILAQGMVIFYGQEGDYHYGAGSESGRKYPGAYVLLWKAIREAKVRGLKYFDLWGIAPLDKPKHRFAGVSLFKRGFGGEVVEYVHALDLIIDPMKYAVDWVIEETRRRVRGLA